MKALTLTQPWATLIAIGAKTLETRSWSTSYRGLIAIHAAKGFPEDARMACIGGPIQRALDLAHFDEDNLPRGVIICTAELVACKQVDLYFGLGEGRNEFRREEPFGDFSVGRWAWFLNNVQPIEPPIPAKGMLGLWEWNAQ